MTTDEFERIAVAGCAMSGFNVGGKYYVSLQDLLRIVHSQLHPDDKSKWQFNPQTMSWRKDQDG